MRLTRPGADAAARGATANVARNNADALSRMGLTRVRANATLYQPIPPPVPKPSGDIRMRRSAGYALFVFAGFPALLGAQGFGIYEQGTDRKSTRLNSSHGYISYAVFCLKKKKKRMTPDL